MAPLCTYGILVNFNQENLKNITTNNKGTRASWDIFEKGNKYHKEGFNLQIHQYCT